MNKPKKVLFCVASLLLSTILTGCIDDDYDFTNLQTGSENVSLGNNISVPISTFKVNLNELIDFSVITGQPQSVSMKSRAAGYTAPSYKLPDFSAIEFDISTEDLSDLNSYAFIEDMKESQTTTLLCWMSGLTLDMNFGIILYGENESATWTKKYDASVNVVSDKLALFKCQLSSADVTDILEGLSKVQFVFDFTETKDDNTSVGCSADDLFTIGLSFSKGEVDMAAAVKKLAVSKLVPETSIVSGELTFRNYSDTFYGSVNEYASLADKSAYKTVILTDDNDAGLMLDSHVKNAEFMGAGSLYKENFTLCSSLERVSAVKANNVFMNAFKSKTTLKSVTLPSVVSVGDNAFIGCASLTQIALPKIHTVGTTIFKECSSLSSVIWPTSRTFDSNALFDASSVWTSSQNDNATTLWTKQ